MKPKIMTVIYIVLKGTSKIQMGPNILKRWLENYSKPIIIVRFLRIPSLISKDQKENIICIMDDVRGDFLGPPLDTTPAAVIGNKLKPRSFKSSEHINEKGAALSNFELLTSRYGYR